MHINTVFTILVFLLTTLNFLSQNLNRQQRIVNENYMRIIRSSNNAEEILTLTEKILQTDSSNTKAIAYRAIGYSRKGDYPEALKIYNLYVAKKPNSWFCAYRGGLKARMGDTIGALIDIEKALKISGNYPRIADYVADVFGSDIRAEKYYDSVLKSYPSDIMSNIVKGMIMGRSKDYKAANERYSFAIKSIYNQPFYGRRIEFDWVYRLKSNADFALRQYKEAIQDISQLILLNPDESNFYKERINYYLIIGDQNKACADLYQLKKLDRTFVQFQALRCDTSNSNNRPSKEWLAEIEAEKLFIQGNQIKGNDSASLNKANYFYAKALDINPKHIYALAGRVDNYAILNQLDKQLIDLNKIIEINPKSAMSYNYRAMIKGDMGNYEGGLEDANMALGIDSMNADYWVTRAAMKIGIGTGDTLQAIADLTRAIKLNPFTSKAYCDRGIIELNYRNSYQPALNDFLKAIEIEDNQPFSSTYAKYYNNSAMAYNLLKQYDKAIIQLDKAIAVRPNNADYYYKSGEIKARQKDMKGACSDWNIALKLGNKEADALILYNCN